VLCVSKKKNPPDAKCEITNGRYILSYACRETITATISTRTPAGAMIQCSFCKSQAQPWF
jgi:hypothetical protein